MKQLKTSSGAFSIWGTQLASKVKRANQRLRQLEKSGISTSTAYRYVENLGMQNNFVGFSKDGKLKFTTNIKKLSDAQARKLEQYVDIFLESKSSTVSGYKELHATNKRYVEMQTGKALTDEEWNKIWGSAVMQSIKSMYGSDVPNKVQTILKTTNMSVDESIEFLTGMLGSDTKEFMDNIEDLENANECQGLDNMTFEDMQKQFIGTI